MNRALIISLNFNPGHVSHMVAGYRQCEELGYEPFYYVNPAFEPFLPSGSRILRYGTDACPQVELAIFLFPSHKNLALIHKLKLRGSKVVYIFHEPLAPMSDYRKAGFSYTYLMRLWVIDHISALTVKKSDVILLPSRKAMGFYESNTLYKNANYYYLPLMYDDELTEQLAVLPRQYFSYIGTIAADHSFVEYLEFVRWAIKEDRLSNIKFLIATKSEFEVPNDLQKSERVIIQKGRPLSDQEINAYYASSVVVWNAYTRTTQSGVLAKSFMFGTPAVVLKKNLSEFTDEGKEVVAIEDNTSFAEIENAVLRVLSDFESYSNNARNRFLKSFYYRNYNGEFKVMIESSKS